MEDKKYKWVVNVKGIFDQRVWEISLVKENNTMGRACYGCWSSEKILICASQGYPMQVDLIDPMMTFVHAHCAFMNIKHGLEDVPKEDLEEFDNLRKGVEKKIARGRKR